VNVTKANFLEQSNDLIANLPNAAFVAIDEEMTGISIPDTPRPPKDDTPEQRYNTLKQVPERYSIIQFGIAIFLRKGDGTQNEFDVKRYNFYLFPSSNAREVNLNPSSIEFLQEHGMDFNRWMKGGIPYCTTAKATEFVEKYRKRALSLLKESDTKPSPACKRKVELTRPEDINFHARSMASLREWIDSARATTNDEGTSFLLPPANRFLRRALYESIEQEYPSLILEKCHNSQIRVLRLTPEEKLVRRERQRKEAFEHFVAQELGFWRVFYALSQANRGMLDVESSIVFAANKDDVNLKTGHLGKASKIQHSQIPIVVHNGLMDILFSFTHFHNPLLPTSYHECKQLISEYFPLLYDTKVMTTEGPRNMRHDNTVLSQLFALVVQPNVVSGLKLLNADDTQTHEASYDAYMTGAVFFGLVLAAPPSDSDGNKIINPWTSTVSSADENLRNDDNGGVVDSFDQNAQSILRQRFACNKLYLMLTMYTIDLTNVEDPLSRGMHINTTFCVSGNDTSISTADIVRCLTSLTAASNNVEGAGLHFEIIWVDDTTFFVAAREDEEDRNLERLQIQGKLIYEALCARFRSSEIVCLRDYNKKRKETAREYGALANIDSNKKRKSLWRFWTWFTDDKADEETNRPNKRRRIA